MTWWHSYCIGVPPPTSVHATEVAAKDLLRSWKPSPPPPQCNCNIRHAFKILNFVFPFVFIWIYWWFVAPKCLCFSWFRFVLSWPFFVQLLNTFLICQYFLILPSLLLIVVLSFRDFYFACLHCFVCRVFFWLFLNFLWLFWLVCLFVCLSFLFLSFSFMRCCS